ncbi:hypothetical protein EJB05_19456, partial [Eragrostis curvula]
MGLASQPGPSQNLVEELVRDAFSAAHRDRLRFAGVRSLRLLPGAGVSFLATLRKCLGHT